MKRLGGLTTITRKGNHSFSSSLYSWRKSFPKEHSCSNLKRWPNHGNAFLKKIPNNLPPGFIFKRTSWLTQISFKQISLACNLKRFQTRTMISALNKNMRSG